MIIVDFFKAIPQFFTLTPVLGGVLVLVLIAAAVAQVLMTRKQLPSYVLPGSLMLGEICCEIFGKTLEGGKMIMLVLGGIFIMGFLGTVIGNLISIARRKNRK